MLLNELRVRVVHLEHAPEHQGKDEDRGGDEEGGQFDLPVVPPQKGDGEGSHGGKEDDGGQHRPSRRGRWRAHGSGLAAKG